ncbi:MAG: Druantia anti-phage system protein DruA [Betaproteobacteria bacterium]|jgi:hypothetical protein
MDALDLFGLPSPDQFQTKSKKAKIIKAGVKQTAASSLFFDEEDLWDFEREKVNFIEHMEFLKNQSVQESTLYRKWKELKQYNTTKHIVKTGMYEDLLWKPRDITDLESTIEDIQNLQPRIIVCEEKTEEAEVWKYLRLLVSSFEFSSGVGRLIRLLFVDDNTGKIIGVSSIASDVVSLGVRDKWIGWSKENKFDDKKLNSTAIGSTIVPTQPFGYNFLGGKLIASLLTTKIVRDAWEAKFGEPLVGLTTTSLYGGHSMYQRIPWWKELGKSAGRISIKPDDDVYHEWVNWLKVNRREDYEKAMFTKSGTLEQDDDCGWYWMFDDEVCTEGGIKTKYCTRDEIVHELNHIGFTVHDNNKVYDPSCRFGHPPSGPKQQLMIAIYRNLGIVQSKFEHGFQRGVYFAPLYENTREFLRDEITSDELILSQKLQNDVEDILSWWKQKAIKRFTKLFNEGSVKPEHLYYRNMIQMSTWDEVTSHYLSDLGR